MPLIFLDVGVDLASVLGVIFMALQVRSVSLGFPPINAQTFREILKFLHLSRSKTPLFRGSSSSSTMYIYGGKSVLARVPVIKSYLVESPS